MSARTRTALTMFILLSMALLGLSWAQPAGRSLGEVCWRLLPFDDVISLNVVQFDLPPKAPMFFTFATHWRGESPPGNLVYEMAGNGSAGYNPGDHVFTLDIVLRNTTPYFGGHRSCQVTAATDGTLHGTWATQCLGATPPFQGGTPFLVQGTFTPMACTPEVSALSNFVALGSAGMLAGMEQQ